jgi:FkbM family methyltransferase
MARRIQAYQEIRTFAELEAIERVDFHSGKTVLTLVDGRSFYWDPTDRIDKLFTISIDGQFEPGLERFVRRVLQLGDNAFDIGACFGWYSLLFGSIVGAKGQVHAFEPIPETFRKLQANLELNGATRVKANQSALGAIVETKTMYLPDIGSSGSLALHHFLRSYQEVEVQITTLDDYLLGQGINQVSYIKADVEGGELDILRGAQNVLDAPVGPIWQLEVQRDSTRRFGYEPEDLFRMMKAYKYDAFVVSRAGELQPFTLESNRALVENNFIFLRPDQADHAQILERG